MKYAILLLLALPCLFAACKKDPVRTIDEGYMPDISLAKFPDPTNFTNPYWPHELGKSYILESQTPEGLEKIEKVRIEETKVVMGIECAVIHDRVWIGGILVEETYDWHAQDIEGNVWYMGEDVNNYNPDGTFLDHAGSWEGGVDDAQPGIIMPADPQVGMKYREEYLFDEAEDEAEVIAVGETLTTSFGTFENCVKTLNFTELDPEAREHKWYAPKIGVIKVLNLADNRSEELVDTYGGYEPDLSPANFSDPTNITNPYRLFPPGKTFVYEAQTDEGLQRVEVKRLPDTKTIMGIECAVVLDQVWLADILIEETYDWFAQDNAGNLWYMGEDVDNYNHDGTFKDHHGAWEAGVDGALPGIIMGANPQVGDHFQEEYLWGEAEDEAEVEETGLTLTVPYGTFENVIKTFNFTRLDRAADEYKYYAPGIGYLKIVDIEDEEELLLVDILN